MPLRALESHACKICGGLQWLLNLNDGFRFASRCSDFIRIVARPEAIHMSGLSPMLRRSKAVEEITPLLVQHLPIGIAFQNATAIRQSRRRRTPTSVHSRTACALAERLCYLRRHGVSSHPPLSASCTPQVLIHRRASAQPLVVVDPISAPHEEQSFVSRSGHPMVGGQWRDESLTASSSRS